VLWMRVRFLRKGGQRAFLDFVIDRLRVKSLRGVLQFGVDVNYSTLKNYYNESRLMSRDLVLEFCEIADIDFVALGTEEVAENWGQVKG
jgi:hypothetical protein